MTGVMSLPSTTMSGSVRSGLTCMSVNEHVAADDVDELAGLDGDLGPVDGAGALLAGAAAAFALAAGEGEFNAGEFEGVEGHVEFLPLRGGGEEGGLVVEDGGVAGLRGVVGDDGDLGRV